MRYFHIECKACRLSYNQERTTREPVICGACGSENIEVWERIREANTTTTKGD